MQWVADWYNEHVGTDFEGAPLPWLYHYYTGHDNNRDWYAFTQQETLLTVEHAHNAWHPQIVHDVHQMGSYGARIFVPPYIEPWEPNVDPALITAVTQLGSYMAAELMAQGKKGVVINGIYDAFTPARAYMHYHGGGPHPFRDGVSEHGHPGSTYRRVAWGPVGITKPVVPRGTIRTPWEGGDWRLADIVEYQKAAALALLTNAARNRRYWLENFHGINRRAVEKWDSWPDAWVIPAGQANESGVANAVRILTIGDVEVHRAEAAFTMDGIDFPAGSYVIPMRQPYGSFAEHPPRSAALPGPAGVPRWPATPAVRRDRAYTRLSHGLRGPRGRRPADRAIVRPYLTV